MTPPAARSRGSSNRFARSSPSAAGRTAARARATVKARATARAMAERATSSAFAGGRYAVERQVGRGGMSTVYLARDRELDRPVAVKVLAETLGADEEF